MTTPVPPPEQTGFDAMMQAVLSAFSGITVDEGEWQTFATYCDSSKTIHEYATQASTLWTDGEDQSSWQTVKAAAETATTMTDDQQALVVVLKAFTMITEPSHNSKQWASLNTTASSILNTLTGKHLGL